MPTALIIGGNRGIGREVVIQLAGKGWEVCAASLTGAGDVLRQASARGVTVRRAQVDVRDTESVERLRHQWDAWHTGLDALVITAGTAVSRPMPDLRPEDLTAMFDEHVVGAYRAVRAFREPLASRRGHVVLLLSRMGRKPDRYGHAYGSAKAALAHLAGCLAAELSDDGVRVNCVCPGPVDTDMLRAAVPHRAALAMAPVDVARVIAQLLGPDFAGVNAAVLDVPGR